MSVWKGTGLYRSSNINVAIQAVVYYSMQVHTSFIVTTYLLSSGDAVTAISLCENSFSSTIGKCTFKSCSMHGPCMHGQYTHSERCMHARRIGQISVIKEPCRYAVYHSLLNAFLS